MKWPLSKRIWRFLHHYANIAAWKFADPGGPAWGRALRIDKNNFWWRLNDWVANHYTAWYIEQVTKKHDTDD